MRIKENKKLGLKLKEIRKRNNMTQLEMAEDMQVHINTIKRYEKGLSIPKEYLKKLSDLFDLDIEDNQELFLLFESNGNSEDFIKLENKKIYFIDNLIELCGYKIYSNYKQTYHINKESENINVVVVEDLKTGLTYNEDTLERGTDILGIYDEIEWYIKALIKRYLNNK